MSVEMKVAPVLLSAVASAGTAQVSDGGQMFSLSTSGTGTLEAHLHFPGDCTTHFLISPLHTIRLFVHNQGIILRC